MRLIGQIEGQKQAYTFASFLSSEGIECRYELSPSTQESTFDIWVVYEEKVDPAQDFFEEYQKNPEDPRFETEGQPLSPQETSTDHAPSLKEEKERSDSLPRSQTSKRTPLTLAIVLLCVMIYIWSTFQPTDRVIQEKSEMHLTPTTLALYYDVPQTISLLIEFAKVHSLKSPEDLDHLSLEDKTRLKAIEAIPVWGGLYQVVLEWPQSKKTLQAPMFEKIVAGQFWRLLTPVFLHGGFFHIIFNMLWLWLLGRQIEERIKKWQYLSITLLIGVISNTCQYLMSGPFFIGYSGIVCGLAGFIWMRQWAAPWEGYPLSRFTLKFLGGFVLAMFALQVISFLLIWLNLLNFPMNIGNTAHISGGITGIILGRIPIFSKANL